MRLTSILSLAGVLGAGSAAAVVNSQVLTNTEAGNAAVTVDATVESATQIYSDLLSPSQVQFQVREAGTVTLDTAGNVLTLVAANANPGWVVVDGLAGNALTTIGSATNGAAGGAAGDASVAIDSVTNIDLAGTAGGVNGAVDSVTNIDLAGTAGGVNGAVDAVTNIDLAGTAGGVPAADLPATDVGADGTVDAVIATGAGATNAATEIVIGFKSLADDEIVQLTAVLNADGTVATEVEDNGVGDENGTDDGTDDNGDGTDGGNGTGTGSGNDGNGNGTDGNGGGVDDANGTTDDDGTGQVCTLTDALVTVCVDADVNVNDGQVDADADVDGRINLNDD